MCYFSAGYGQTVLNSLRHLNRIKEFPLILGREFSGIVKAKGKSVRKNIQVGDKVFGIVPTHQPGSLAEYVVVDQNTVRHKENCDRIKFNRSVIRTILNLQIVRKPDNIDDVGAAGIMFAGLTAWSSLYLSGLAGGFRGAITSRGLHIIASNRNGVFKYLYVFKLFQEVEKDYAFVFWADLVE